MPYFHQSYQSTEHHTGVIFSISVREVQQWCQILLATVYQSSDLYTVTTLSLVITNILQLTCALFMLHSCTCL